jgi:RNase P/RNase MRP subunit p29
MIKKWVGKVVSVIFDDGSKIVKHTGKLIAIESNFLVLNYNDGEEAIPFENIIRVYPEVKNE